MPDTITLAEIKKLIEDGGISPDELFSIEQQKDSSSMQGYIKEVERKAAGGEYLHRERTDKKFLEESENWKKEKEEKDKKIKELEIKGAKRDATELFTTKMKERKLDKKQISYVEKKQKDFEPEDLDNVDKEVDKFMDSSLEEFNEDAKIFGHKTEEPKGEPKGGGEPGEGGSEEDNELIPD